MVWWHNARSVGRDELMAGALQLADRQWPVVPGTFWQGRGWAGMPDAPRSGPVPVPENGLAGATCDSAAIVGWWTELPYSVLLPTGSVLDAIEVPPPVGRRLSAHLGESGIVAPAGTTPTGRWWFLVRPGEPLRPELESRSDVILHGRGSWLVAPPSQDPRGLVRWSVPPAPVVPVSNDLPSPRTPVDLNTAGSAPETRRPRTTAPPDKPRTTALPDTYDVQLALLDVLGQRSMVAAAASAVGAVRVRRRT